LVETAVVDTIRQGKIMRILHVYKDYHPVVGGIENHIANIAGAQAAAGHDVQVLVTNPGGQPAREMIRGVAVMRAARLFTAASTPVSLTLPVLLRRTAADIVHLHFPYPPGELAYLGVGGGRPLVIAYHSDVVKQKRLLRLYRPFLRRILQRADALIVGSDAYVRSSPYLQPHAEKCHVIPYAVDNEWFGSGQPLFNPEKRPTLLFLGRHRYYKGVDTLLEAMPAIDAQLLIGGDGPLRGEWEALTDRLNLRAKVRFLGKIPHAQMPDFYAGGTIFVLPANARAEAFGKVLQEAMAAGLPCVTTELGTGTSFVVRHEESGLVVPPRDPAALATAINRLLAEPDRAAEMGAAGRRRAQTEFTRDNLYRQDPGRL
jgi:glycosyltransferase involved in cell wall biosynthesis